MTEFLEIYSQTGMVGIVGAMCVYMVYHITKSSHKNADDIGDLMVENKGQSETMENMEGAATMAPQAEEYVPSPAINSYKKSADFEEQKKTPEDFYNPNAVEGEDADPYRETYSGEL